MARGATMRRVVLVVLTVAALATFNLDGTWFGVQDRGPAAPDAEPAASGARVARVVSIATFAAGCFWCVEADFDEVPGVLATTSGYTGGRLPNPTYAQVSSGGTGHTEAVRVTFDAAVVSYAQLLAFYWRHVDPFAVNRQFCDVGEQYRAEIFVHGAAQRAVAEASRAAVQTRFSARIVVPITDAGAFYPAEDHHQDYHRTHALRYRFYRRTCGRDARVAAIWGG